MVQSREAGLRWLPVDVPADPRYYYADSGWIGWSDWLGNGRKVRFKGLHRPFTEARAWVRKLGLRGASEWGEYCARGFQGKPAKPEDIPAAPHRIYEGEGWSGMSDWLGNGCKPQKPRKKPS